VRFVVDKVALAQVFPRDLWFAPVSTIPPMLHIHLHLQVAVTRRTNGRSLGTPKEETVFWKYGECQVVEIFSVCERLELFCLNLLM
jgi:hypothetical protein